VRFFPPGATRRTSFFLVDFWFFVCRFVLSAETAGKGPADRAEWNLLEANIFEVNWLLAAKSGNGASSSFCV
jgi:hypothetical protein